jgi:hypothetical protein
MAGSAFPSKTTWKTSIGIRSCFEFQVSFEDKPHSDIFVMLGIKLRTWHMLGRCSTTELYLQPCLFSYFVLNLGLVSIPYHTVPPLHSTLLLKIALYAKKMHG